MIWIYVLKVVRDGNDYFSACCSSRFGAGANNWKSLIKGRKIKVLKIFKIFLIDALECSLLKELFLLNYEV